MNQAPTPDNSSSCSNIEIGFLKKNSLSPFWSFMQDKSNSCDKNFWLAITYYFKDSKKCCHICRGQALSSVFGVRPYPNECHMDKGKKRTFPSDKA